MRSMRSMRWGYVYMCDALIALAGEMSKLEAMMTFATQLRGQHHKLPNLITQHGVSFDDFEQEKHAGNLGDALGVARVCCPWFAGFMAKIVALPKILAFSTLKRLVHASWRFFWIMLGTCDV
jgi:hypothetical protein